MGNWDVSKPDKDGEPCGDAISRRAAIDAIRKDVMGGLNYEGILTRLPPVTPKQEPCGDTVSRGVFEQVVWERNVAIDQLKELGYGFGEKIRTDDDSISRQAVLDILARYEDAEELAGVLIRVIKQLPSVTPKQRTGHWILRDDINGQYQCDECGMFSGLSKFDVEEAGWKLSNFCSNCGAKMVKPQESEEQV